MLCRIYTDVLGYASVSAETKQPPHLIHNTVLASTRQCRADWSTIMSGPGISGCDKI